MENDTKKYEGWRDKKEVPALMKNPVSLLSFTLKETNWVFMDVER